jgi:general secretion pathway protein G
VNVLPGLAKAKVGTAKAQIQEFRTALDLYRAEQGRYPTQQQGLPALVQKPTVPPIPATYPSEPYLKSRKIPLDPWGNEFVYMVPGPDGLPYEILSYGSDGEPGGTDEAADIGGADL